MFSILSSCLIAPSHGDIWSASQDTSVYEFLGNLGGLNGDSSGLFVWNHESSHGAKGLLQFDSAWSTDSALTGDFSATLNLYQFCEPEGFVGACPGDPGAPSVTTDIFLQQMAWSEAGMIGWDDVSETGSPTVSFTQTGSSGWIAIDITDLVVAWLGGVADYGLAFSQEAYDVIRADVGSIAVSAFCDSESSGGVCATGNLAPYLEFTPVPVPAAVWLLATGLLGLIGVARRKSKNARFS